ncbi:aldo/keto reductase [Streptomyces aurantiogriseus]|nr:aldo/keto reductase [Streptomyces aurantiogriseus]
MTSGTITADAAGTWTVGDLPVHRIGFGAMRLTGSAAFHLGTPTDRDRSIAVLRKAIDLGVNHIDTAAFYFSSLRSANELINSALSPYPDDLIRLAWILSQGPHVLAIPGTGNPDHLIENVAAGGLRLTDEEMQRLDGLRRKAG